MESWKTRAAGQTKLHVSQWAAHEWGQATAAWQLRETLIAKSDQAG